MHDYGVTFPHVKPGGILENDLFIDGLFLLRKLDGLSLERIVKFFGATEKVRRALDQIPVGIDASRIHLQRERCQNFRDPAAVEGRTDVRHTLPANTLDFPKYPLGHSRADQRLVMSKRMEAERRPLGRRC